MPDKDIRVVISAQDNASRTIKNTAKDLKTVDAQADKMSKTFGRLGTAIVGAFSVAAITNFTKAILNQAGAVEQDMIAFETLLGGVENANNLMDELVDFAKRTPFNRQDLVEGTKRLLAYNVGQEDVIKTMEMLGNISSGVGREKLPQLILAFGQVKAATRLTGAELRQFAEAGVPLLDQLAQNFGVTAGEMQEMISGGEIGFNDVQLALQKMTGEGGKFFELMDKQSESFLGKISNLQDGFQILAANIGELLIPMADNLTASVINLVDQLNALFEGSITLTEAINNLGLDGEFLTGIWNNNLKPAIDGVTKAGQDLIVELKNMDVDWGSLAKTLTELVVKAFELSLKIMEHVINFVKDNKETIEGFANAFKMLAELVNAAFDAFNKLNEAINKIDLGRLGDILEKVSGFKGIPDMVLKTIIPGGAFGFKHGGTVPGSPNTPVPAVLHGGERVIPRTAVGANASGGGGQTINVTVMGNVSGQETIDQIVEAVKMAIGRDNELARLGVGI